MDPSYESSIYNLLGVVYLKLFDYDNSLYYYKKGLNLKIDETRKLKSNTILLWFIWLSTITIRPYKFCFH